MHPLVVFPAETRLPCGAALLTPSQALDLFLGRLPLRARLLAAAVCRAWRAALADPSAWTRLVLEPCCTDAMLLAASVRAHGRLELLDVSDARHMMPDTLIIVATANAAALRELRGVGYTTFDWERVRNEVDVSVLRRLVTAAPALRVLDVAAVCSTTEEARMLLRCEPPFGAVRTRELKFRSEFVNEEDLSDMWPVLADAPALTSFKLSARLRSREALDSFADAAVAGRPPH